MTSARPHSPLLSLAIFALTGSPIAALLGCSATTGTDALLGGGGSGMGGTSSTSSDTGGDRSDTGEGDGISIDVGASGDGDGQSGVIAGCATSSVEARLLPLNMFIAVDKSGSMNENGKWDSAKMAFSQFFQDPAAANLRVALRFWPDDQPASTPNKPALILCNRDVDLSCGPAVVAACQRPEVDIGSLADPAHQQALIDAFEAHEPHGFTPTSAALQGATRWCANHVVQTQKTEKAVVLLVTDGEPTHCVTDPQNIAALADIAYQGAGVLTFAVGLAGSNPSVMNTIAKGGHTGQAFMIGNGDTAAELLSALKKIQGDAVACSFEVPAPPPGETLDPLKVNVQYASGSGAVPSTIGQVSSYGACGQKGGWYYDHPQKPTEINLCPASCNTIQADDGAKIKVVLGCSTQPG